MAEEVGTGYVSLIPSARGFGKRAKAMLKAEMGKPGGAGSDPATVPVKPEIDTLTSTLRAELQKQLQAVARKLTLELKAVADTDGLKAKVEGQLAQLKESLVLAVPTEPGGTEEYRRKLRETLGSVRPVQKIKVEPPDKKTIEQAVRETTRKVASEVTSRGGSEVTQGGGALGRLFVSGFGGTLLNPLIGIPALIVGALASPYAAAVTGGAILAGGGIAAILLGAFALRADEDLKKAASGLGETFNTTLANAAKPLKGPFLQAIGIISTAIKGMGPTLKRAFEILGPSIPKLASGFAGLLQSLRDTGALEKFATAMGPVLDQVAMALPDIGNAISQFMISMAEIGPEAAAGLGIALRTVADVIRVTGDIMVWLVHRIRDIGVAVNWVKEVFSSSGISDAVEGWGIILDGFANTVIGVAKTIEQWWRGLWSGMSSKVSSTVGETVLAARALPGKIVSAVGNLGALLVNAGRNVVQGLIDGIRSRFGGLADAARQMAGTIRAFLPFSPAKVGPLSGSGAPYRSGQIIASDMAAGVHSQLPKVAGAGAELAGVFGVGGSGIGLGARAAASGGLVAQWAPDATGDQLLDALRGLIDIRYGGDPDLALSSRG